MLTLNFSAYIVTDQKQTACRLGLFCKYPLSSKKLGNLQIKIEV